MKKTRILAAILAVMMVVGIMPMMKALATEEGTPSAITCESMEEIMNAKGVANIYSCDFTDGTPADAAVTGTINLVDDGIEFPKEEASTVKLAPSADPWKLVNATVLKGKFESDAITEKMFITGATAGGYSRHYTTLYPDRITSPNGSTSGSFAFGTDWFELLVFSKIATETEGFEIWAKNDTTDGKWVQVIQSMYRKDTNGDTNSGSGFTIQSYATNTGTFTLASIDVFTSAYNSIEEIMGVEKPLEKQVELSYDFTKKGFAEESQRRSEIKYLSQTNYSAVPVYTENVGMTLTGTDNGYWYIELKSNPLLVDTATVFTMKHTAETDKTLINIKTPDGGCTYTTITAKQIASNTTSTNVAAFPFGTDPFELLYVPKTVGYQFYARNASTQNMWIKVVDVAESRTTSLPNGIMSIANSAGTDGVVVSGIQTYGTEKQFFNSIEEILGGDVVSSYAFDFNDDFDATIMANSSASMTTGLDCTDQYGIDLNDGAWNFNAYKAKNWSPLNGNLPGETYIPQALYFNMKFNTIGAESTLTGGTPSVDGRLYRGLKAGSALNLNGATGTVTAAIALDTNWTEHLIVPAATETGGYSHYIKSPTLTNDKWIKVVETTNYRDAGTEKNGIGVNFSQTDACIKSLRTYQLATKDENAKPQDATLLYHQEEFDTEPKYANLTISNGTYQTAGIVSFPATDSTNYGKYTLNYAGIPVGGYAEFKASSNGAIIANFADEEKTVTWNIFKPYTGMEGSSDSYLFGDSNNLARIFRVIRTADGYTMYTKSDSDLGWQKVCENAGFAAADSTIPKITFVFRNHSDGASVGSGLLDYMKIYGPAKADKLIVTDGYGTKEFKNGDTIGYGSALRPIVNAEAGKLMVANYKKNQLTKLTVLDASELTVDKLISVVQGGTDTVKVFLWNGLDGKMENADDVLTLNFPTMNN